MKTIQKRVVASIIDFGIIAIYGTILFATTTFIHTIFNLKYNHNPYSGQVTGFITLTLPVIMYFYLSEKGKWKGTVGKKIQKITVETSHSNRAKCILKRNILKFLPWEFAHTGIHWAIYYDTKGVDTPFWVWILLILPQLIVVVYFVSILRSMGRKSVYDSLANTKITYQADPE